MIAELKPSISQIRFFAEAALSTYETLDGELAAEVIQGELRSLIRYLDALDNANNAVLIDWVGEVELDIKIEDFVRHLESGY